MAERAYLAIDLKSFYASVECAARGLDPLKTNLVVADAARTAQSEADYLARVEAALAEEPEAGMTLLGRTVSWTETNDEGRTLICAVELQERGAFPRYVKAVYRLVTDEGEPDGEERLFDAAGEL